MKPKTALELAYDHMEKLMASATSDQEKKGWFPDYKIENAFVAGFSARDSEVKELVDKIRYYDGQLFFRVNQVEELETMIDNLRAACVVYKKALAEAIE